MINELKEDVNRLLGKSSNRLVRRYNNLLVLYLIYLKNLCEEGKYKYEEVIYDDNIYELFHIIKVNKDYFDDVPINSLLRNISIYNSIDLAKEFLNEFESITPIYDDKEEKIMIINSISGYLSGFINLSCYDSSGLTTYITKNENSYEYFFEIFKALDEIFKVNNKYLLEEEIDFSKYNYLCIYDTKPKYRFINDYNEFSQIRDYIPKIDNIILYTRYNKISNFKYGRIVLRSLKAVILDNEQAILIFNRRSREISIINYDKEKIKSIDKLKSIIENNRKQKDILVKTNYEEVISNNSRIGFSLYELSKSKEIKDINRIVDENTRLLEDLNRINETVEEEINKLLNR